jgi:hypothetical protein
MEKPSIGARLVTGVLTTLKSLPTLAPLIAGVIVGLEASHIYPMRFFEVTAQVIPVFFLALAVELRAFKFPAISLNDLELPGQIDKTMQVLNNWAAVFVALVALIGGEVFALVTVAYGHPTWKFGQGIVLGACFAGAVMIGVAGLSSTGKGSSSR